MKRLKQALSLGMAGVMMTAVPVTAFAASPEFSRSAEEWAKLRDNTIEYDELEGLIQEYNATVQTNNLDLAEFKRKYGDTKDDVSSKYRDMADEIYSSINYPESDDVSYGMMVGSVVMAEVQAKNMEQQADDNLQDSEIVYLNYKSAEKTLVTVAQSNMISYEKDQLALKQAELAKRQAEIALTSTQTHASLGMSSEVDVLNAKESIQNADRNVESSKAAIENVRQKLQVMLGWKYNDTPEITEVPASDMSRIAAMDPAADKDQALENNYTLKVNKKKLANATSDNTKESLQKTIEDNERKIGSALVTNYQNVLTAKLAYDQAEANLELAKRNLNSLQLQFAQGKASRNQLENQQITVENAELSLKTADLTLFQTMETYDWAVNGLASTS